MLKPADPGQRPPERQIGELVHQLVEDGKAYARAEYGLATAIAEAKARALGVVAALFAAALLVAQAAVTVLAVAVFFVLTAIMNPILAGLLAVLVFAALSGGIAWYAWQRLKRELLPTPRKSPPPGSRPPAQGPD